MTTVIHCPEKCIVLPEKTVLCIVAATQDAKVHLFITRNQATKLIEELKLCLNTSEKPE